MQNDYTSTTLSPPVVEPVENTEVFFSSSGNDGKPEHHLRLYFILYSDIYSGKINYLYTRINF
jgi:hypothetical protein